MTAQLNSRPASFGATRHICIATENKRDMDLEVLDDSGSQYVINEIFHKRCYNAIPFVSGVRSILDVGANMGLASAWFRNCYPEAAIHAFEPEERALTLLQRNANEIGGVTVHPFGLFNQDCTKEFFVCKQTTVHNSIFDNRFATGTPAQVELKDAGPFIRSEGLENADILKVDTEGCEIPILKSFGEITERFKVIYLEFHSEHDRRELDNMLSVSHQLYFGDVICGIRGQYTYVRRDLVDSQQKPADELRPLT